MEEFYMLNRGDTRRVLDRMDPYQRRTHPELKLVEARDYVADRRTGYDCWRYVFENSNAREMGLTEIDHLKGGILLKDHVKPRPNSIVAYIGDRTHPWGGRIWRVPMHVGRVIDVSNGKITVRSKFGVEDVYEHPIGAVPLTYGRDAKFVYIDGFFDGID